MEAVLYSTFRNHLKDYMKKVIPNHSYLSQLDVTYKTPDLMSHFLPPHEVSFTFCCSSIVFPR
ncbi:ABC transporter membrane protein [Streptococcus pneumoniae]|nr:ABC transporter membrane protein [Streptococcus pneumoniae]